jgi:hypothetical protein
MTRADYDAVLAMNCSSIKPGVDIEGGSYVAYPWRIRHAWMRGEVERTMAQQDTLNFGTAVHLAVLEPRRFEAEVVHFSGDRRGTAWKDFKSENEGKLILRTKGTHGYDNIGRLLTAVMEFPEWKMLTPYLGDCQREVAVVTYENGVAKKGLIDVASKSGAALLDLKTTAVSNWKAYDSVSWKLGYWLSMGSYVRWWNSLSDWQFERAIQLVVVVAPPYDLVIRPMDPMSLDMGWETQLRACGELKGAIRDGRWTGSGGGMEVPLLLPSWAVPDENLEFTT